MRYAFLLVSSLVLLSCNYEHASLPAAPSVPPVNYTITGTVRDSEGRPIEGADVTMVVTTKGSPVWKTDGTGRYQIRLTPSIYTFTISKAGFRTLRATVRVDGDTTADFVLLAASGP